MVPAARQTGLVESRGQSGDSLVYDIELQQMHQLSPLVAEVRRAAVGVQSLESLTRTIHLNTGTRPEEADVRLALTKLAEARLLDSELPGTLRVEAPRRTYNRRRVIASVGAAATIASISIPQAASAASCGAPCTKNSDCTTTGCTKCNAKVLGSNDKVCRA